MDDCCVKSGHKLNDKEKASLYYICGYIVHKELIEADDDNVGQPFSEFTGKISRGKLKHPPQWLFSFSCFAYSFFTSVSPSCSTRTTLHLSHIFDRLFFAHAAKVAIIRRLTACFFKGLVRRSDDEYSVTPTLALNERKNIKLSSA